MAEDRVLSGTYDGRQYRVVAGSAFSWAYLLVEDRLGERFILDTDHRALTPVSDLEAAGLLESRSYREWNGAQRWLTVPELVAIDGRSDPEDSPAVPPPAVDTPPIR
jgi:hypothetical protein